MKKAKNNFYRKKLSKWQGNTKQLCQVMKEITHKVNQRGNSFRKTLKINKKSLYSAEHISNELNSFPCGKYSASLTKLHGIFDAFEWRHTWLLFENWLIPNNF